MGRESNGNMARALSAVVAGVVVLSGAGVRAGAQPASISDRAAVPALRAPEVFVIGDSISEGGGAEIDAAFAAEGWNRGRIARSGKTVVDMRPFIRYIAAVRKPDVMVIELGTNDMGGVAFDDEELAAYARAVTQVERALQDMRHVPCVVWINVSDWTNLDFGRAGRYDLMTWAPPYNADLERAAHSRGNVHVIDYAGQIGSKGLAWIADNSDDWLIHPDTPEGKRAVADLMAAGVQRACDL